MGSGFTVVNQRIKASDTQSAAALHAPEGIRTACSGEDGYRNLHFEISKSDGNLRAREMLEKQIRGKACRKKRKQAPEPGRP